MRRILLPILFFILLSGQMKGQEKSDFNIIAPNTIVGDSKYNNLYYIEARPNPLDMGHAYVNTWSGIQGVTISSSFDSQFQSLIKTINPMAGEKKAMAVQMRALFFSIGTDENRGKGLCNLRMTLYEVDNDDKLYFLNTIDTLLVSTQKEIKATASTTIVSFISGNLPYYAAEGEQALDMQQVMDIDFYEKNSIPFYTESRLPDGVYSDYKSLKVLTPAYTSDITTKVEDGNLKEVKIPDPKKPGKTKKLKAKDIYAVVIDGIPYISYDGAFCQAYKKDGDWRFAFTRKVAGSGFSLGIGVGGRSGNAAGGIGIGIPIGGKKEKIEMFIDHLNGDFYWGGKVGGS